MKKVVIPTGKRYAGWCTGGFSNGLAVCMLLVQLLILLIFFALHCTPIIDPLVDEDNARHWIGVTPSVRVASWIILPPAVAHCVYIIAQVTCRWRQTALAVQEEIQKCQTPRDAGFSSKKMAKSSTAVLLCKFGCYHSSTQSPFFLYVLWLSELWEFVFQALAIVEFSRAGVDKTPLVIITAVLFLNALSPVVVAGYGRRVDHDRLFLGRLTQWVLLFDTACDTVYASISLALLLNRYGKLFAGRDHGYAANICARYSAAVGRDDCSDVKSFLLLAQGRMTCFGGRNLWETFIKFNARVLPLVFSPQRIYSAFQVRYSCMIIKRGASFHGGASPPSGNRYTPEGDGEGEGGQPQLRSASTPEGADDEKKDEDEEEKDINNGKDGGDEEEVAGEGDSARIVSRNHSGSVGMNWVSIAPSSIELARLGEAAAARPQPSSTREHHTHTRGSVAEQPAAGALTVDEEGTHGGEGGRGAGGQHASRDSRSATHALFRKHLLKRWPDVREVYHRPVPRILVVLLSVVSLCFCVIVWFKLALWGDCPSAVAFAANNGTSGISSVPPAACLVRAYPIFDTTHHAPESFCACNTLLFDERKQERCDGSNNTALRHQLQSITRVADFLETVFLSVPCPDSVGVAQALIGNMSLFQTLNILHLNAWGSEWDVERDAGRHGRFGDLGVVPAEVSVEQDQAESWDASLRKLSTCTTLTSVELRRVGVRRLDWLAALNDLRSVNVFDSRCDELPRGPALLNLQHLAILKLNRGRLAGRDALPAELMTLPKLIILEVQFQKQLLALPDIQLPAIRIMRLYENALTTCPNIMIDGGGTLETLDLSLNQITEVPAEIQRLSAVTRLHLSSNLLTALPTSIGMLSTLLELAIASNDLRHGEGGEVGGESLPSELGLLTSLTSFDIRSNPRVTSLPNALLRPTPIRVWRVSPPLVPWLNASGLLELAEGRAKVCSNPYHSTEELDTCLE